MSRDKPPYWSVRIATLAFATIFAGVGAYSLYDDMQFDGAVGRSTATIDRLWTSTTGRHGPSHNVSFHYVAGGVPQSITNGSIYRDTYNRLHAGQQISVKYLLVDPSQSRIDMLTEERGHWDNDTASFSIGLVMLAGVAVIWYFTGKTLST
jgi:hypothetical protein